MIVITKTINEIKFIIELDKTTFILRIYGINGEKHNIIQIKDKQICIYNKSSQSFYLDSIPLDCLTAHVFESENKGEFVIVIWAHDLQMKSIWRCAFSVNKRAGKLLLQWIKDLKVNDQTTIMDTFNRNKWKKISINEKV